MYQKVLVVSAMKKIKLGDVIENGLEPNREVILRVSR